MDSPVPLQPLSANTRGLVFILLGADGYPMRRYKLPEIIKADAELLLLFKALFLLQVLKAVFSDEAKGFLR